MLKTFYEWYQNELKTRGYCPGNWKWILPPFFSSYTAAYMGLNKMTEYTIKPTMMAHAGFRTFIMQCKQSKMISEPLPKY